MKSLEDEVLMNKEELRKMLYLLRDALEIANEEHHRAHRVFGNGSSYFAFLAAKKAMNHILLTLENNGFEISNCFRVAANPNLIGSPTRYTSKQYEILAEEEVNERAIACFEKLERRKQEFEATLE